MTQVSDQIDWQRHRASGDRRWHVIAATVFGGSTVTRCRGRWPETDAVDRSTNPPVHERCGACCDWLRELRSAVDFDFDMSDVPELGGES